MTLTPNRLHQGNCLELLGQLESGTVDLAFADPPFNIGYQYDVYDDQRSSEEYLGFCRDWMSQVDRVLKPNGTFWLAIGDEYVAELKVLANQLGLTCRTWVIWYYTFGVNCVRGFSRSHTHLLHLVKDPKDFTFNGDNPAVRVASARQLVYADGRANPKGRLPDNTWILRPQDVPRPGFSPSHDTWYFSRVAGTFKEREGFHGCQMPEQLLGRIIRVSSRPGDLVLDPFAGSGTTLVVAKKLGRRWIGTELSEEYAERAQARLEACRAGDRLDGPSDPLASAPATASGKRKGRFRNGRPVVSLDPETEGELIEAYREAADGYPLDYVLCDPETNAEFINRCRRRGVGGSPGVWNRILLRLRKAGRLPKANRRAPALADDKLERAAAASEVAMALIALDYGMAFDEMLCSPDAVAEFDRVAESFAPGQTPLVYRWAALSLRKRAKLARRLATEQEAEWETLRTPPKRPIGSLAADAVPGVYEWLDEQGSLYIGQTSDLAARLGELGSEGWKRFGPTHARLWEIDQPQRQLALRAFLVARRQPLLNSSLLRGRSERRGKGERAPAGALEPTGG